MYLRAKNWHHWRWSAFGWRGSVMLGRYRSGMHSPGRGVLTIATPFVLMNIIKPWKPAR